MFVFVCLMVFNANFNNISVISRWSVLLVEEATGPGENHQPQNYATPNNHYTYSIMKPVRKGH